MVIRKLLKKIDITVTEEFTNKFIEAERTFLHQRVFDLRDCTVKPLSVALLPTPAPTMLPTPVPENLSQPVTTEA